MTLDITIENDLKQLRRQLDAFERKAAPQATVRTLNRVAESARVASTKHISPQLGSKQAGVKRRIETRKATLQRLWVTLVAVLVAGPIGLGAAIYLSEYAKPRVRRSVKPVVEVLASIPSVVVGYFAIRFIAPELVQRIFPGAPAKNLLVAGIAVGLLTIPLMTSVAEDALRAVPLNLREASYGLGAKKVTTVIRVVVPAAVSGLVAGLILSISRAIGETMVVFLAAGGVPTRPTSPLDGGTTVTAAMAAVATGTDNVAGASNTFQSAFFLGLILFAFTLTLNLVADRFVRRVRQKY